jgi:hypothetical protein
MSATKKTNIDSAKGPEWESKMSDIASNMLVELLGFTPSHVQLTEIVNKNSINLCSRDRYESITIVFTPKGQVLRHYISSAKAVDGYAGIQTLNVWIDHVPASKAENRLRRKYELLLDRRMQSRVPKVNSPIIRKRNFSNERESKYEIKRLNMVASFLIGTVNNDNDFYDYIEKNSFKLFSRDNYESIDVVLTPKGQVLRLKVNVNASNKNIPSSQITMVWDKHVDVNSAKSILTKEIWEYFDKRLGERLYDS